MVSRPFFGPWVCFDDCGLLLLLCVQAGVCGMNTPASCTALLSVIQLSTLLLLKLYLSSSPFTYSCTPSPHLGSLLLRLHPCTAASSPAPSLAALPGHSLCHPPFPPPWGSTHARIAWRHWRVAVGGLCSRATMGRPAIPCMSPGAQSHAPSPPRVRASRRCARPTFVVYLYLYLYLYCICICRSTTHRNQSIQLYYLT